MSPGEHLAAYNRSPRQRARASVMATLRNRQERLRGGKYLVPEDVIDEIAAMRRRGRSWGTIAMRYGISPSAARHRLARRRPAP